MSDTASETKSDAMQHSLTCATLSLETFFEKERKYLGLKPKKISVADKNKFEKETIND